MSARVPIEGQSMTATSLDRRIQMLRTAMGPLIAAALEDPDVVEVMLNPDRTLWVDRLSSGRAPMGVELPDADGERIIRLVAAHVGAEVHRGQPLLSAELPETGERFEGILPPAVPGPAFALRKRAIGVIPLERYVIDGMMTSAQAGFLVRAVRERQNVLIVGATSSGKTTLANALLAEIAATGDRVLVLEDTVELQCAARDHVPLRTRAGVVSMTELVRSSMRLRPDRVVVGEVRGAEALDLIKVWGTGHPGGIATIHAGSALGALLRLEQLILEVAVNPPRALIAEAVNVVIHIAGRGRKRRIESIARVVGFDGVGYQLADALETPFPELPPLPNAAPAAATSSSPSLNPSGNCHDARPCFPCFRKSAFAPVHPRAAAVPGRNRAGRRFLDAVGRPAAIHPRLHPGAGGAHRRGHHHHRHGPRARLRRHVRRIPQADPDRLRSVHRLCGFELLPVVLQLLRRGRRMSAPDTFVAGFEVPLHRSLTEPILLGGAPRTMAIANGTLAAAVGLGLQLWIPGVVLWIVGHSLAVWGARVDPQFMQVFARHIKHRPLLDV
ncbi:VirB11 [Klebsiella pneumoniae]|nr:VirB11 [Klebsiella pneumoniae]